MSANPSYNPFWAYLLTDLSQPTTSEGSKKAFLCPKITRTLAVPLDGQAKQGRDLGDMLFIDQAEPLAPLVCCERILHLLTECLVADLGYKII